MNKIKHEKELEKLANKLMNTFYNKNGVDKTYIYKVLLNYQIYFSRLKILNEAMHL